MAPIVHRYTSEKVLSHGAAETDVQWIRSWSADPVPRRVLRSPEVDDARAEEIDAREGQDSLRTLKNEVRWAAAVRDADNEN
jgi:hypothetical protein